METAGELPDGSRPERVLRLEAEQELLELVETAESGHGSGERTRRRAVDPADPWPERCLREAPQEAELEQDPVDSTTGENEGDVVVPTTARGV